MALGTITLANKKYHKPTQNDVYVGRGSSLGNPYSHIPSANAIGVQDRETAIKMYKAWLRKQLSDEKKDTLESQAIRKMLNDIYIKVRDGKDVVLVCYCVPKSCHAEYIKELIESKF